MQLAEELRLQAAEVEEWLDLAIPEPELSAAPRLVEAMRYSLLAGGKRLRPVLCVWACAVRSGGTGAAVRQAAVALEMLHTYSLIHDDLPAMDDDDLRRGRPSCHRAFDEATAVLAGDALQTLAFGTLATVEDSGLARDLAVWLARASGLAGMAAGQQLDLEATGAGVDPASVELIHRMKTGALIAAALCMGARSGGLAQADLEPVWEAGQQLGIAFQIVDDVLDQTTNPAQLGKSVGKDLRQGKQTALADATPVEALATARRKVESAISALRDAGLADTRLEALCFYLVERDH
jgi:geranylgeranyl diphosphate synthase type II